MTRLFLSDLHLADPQTPAFRTFASLMAQHSARVDEIYLLGDLCEVWVGDDDDGPLARALIEVLAQAARAARVFVMRGNRDFLFAERFQAESGATLIADPYRLDARTLLAHGDAFCIDDQQYQEVRKMLRSPDWQQQVLARTLVERRALAQAMRQQSAATNANKAENIMDVSLSEVARVVAEHGCERLIHGHTHRPGIHPAPWGQRYVLGAWERCGWILEQDQTGALSLQCLPLQR
ncbi:MAG: UDP-2,3-diacylglucosamine diphosphatase [Pseudomonadales bacterium]